MATQSSPGSDYLTVKTLLSRMEANSKLQGKDQKSLIPCPPPLASSSPAITPRTRRKLQDQIEDLHPRDQMAFCRADVRACGNLHDLLDNFHQTFSEDQLWAIVFQFMTLYRSALVSYGGSGGQRTVSRASSSGQSSSGHNDSSCSNSSTVSTSGGATTTSSRNISPGRRKSKSAGAANAKNKKKLSERKILNQSSDSDASCSASCSSDVEASDNSDIMSELMLDGDEVEEEEEKKKSVRGVNNKKISGSGAKAGGCAGGEVVCSSDEDEGGDQMNGDNEKPKSRLDHVDYLNVPTSLRNFHIHKDGSVHVAYVDEGM